MSVLLRGAAEGSEMRQEASVEADWAHFDLCSSIAKCVAPSAPPPFAPRQVSGGGSRLIARKEGPIYSTLQATHEHGLKAPA